MQYVIDTSKPHRGRIERWHKSAGGFKGLGCIIVGNYLDHPKHPGIGWHTSYVVAHDEATGEIETRNSRYTLIGPESQEF